MADLDVDQKRELEIAKRRAVAAYKELMQKTQNDGDNSTARARLIWRAFKLAANATKAANGGRWPT